MLKPTRPLVAREEPTTTTHATTSSLARSANTEGGVASARAPVYAHAPRVGTQRKEERGVEAGREEKGRWEEGERLLHDCLLVVRCGRSDAVQKKGVITDNWVESHGLCEQVFSRR